MMKLIASLKSSRAPNNFTIHAMIMFTPDE